MLFEAKAILTKVYGEDPVATTHKLSQVGGGPVVLLELDPAEVTTVFRLTDTYALACSPKIGPVEMGVSG